MASSISDRAPAGLMPVRSRMQKRLTAAFERHRERARIARELLSCSNRELFDLGISGGDIPAVIAGTYTRTAPAHVGNCA